GGVADALAINNTNTMSINNSIVFGSVLTVGSGTYTAQHSLIEGDTNTANGNIDATGITVNDVFTDAANGDYTLKHSSPAINKGNNSLNSTTADLAGNLRVFAWTIDMGAYEFHLSPDANSIIYVKETATGTGKGNSWDNA